VYTRKQNGLDVRIRFKLLHLCARGHSNNVHARLSNVSYTSFSVLRFFFALECQ